MILLVDIDSSICIQVCQYRYMYMYMCKVCAMCIDQKECDHEVYSVGIAEEFAVEY